MMRDTATGYAIVGLGYGATRCAMLQETAGSRLAAVVDTNPERAQEYGAAYDVPAYDALEAVLHRDDVDVVAIYTPSGLHLPLALEAVRAGKHILLTKPMEVSAERADRIVNAAHEHGVEVFSEHYLRYYPDNLRTKRAITAGDLGDLILGEFGFKCYRPLAYYTSDGAWRQTRELNGGGIVMNQAIHAIDQLVWLMGEPENVQARVGTFGMELPVENTAVATLKMRSGAIATLVTTSTFRTTSGVDDMYGGGFTTRAEVNGTLGSVALIDNDLAMEKLETGDVPPLAEAPVNVFADVSRALAEPGYVSDTLVRGNQGRIAIEVAQAIYEAGRTGEVVELDGDRLGRR